MKLLLVHAAVGGLILGEGPTLTPPTADDLSGWSRGVLEDCYSSAKDKKNWDQALECMEELLQGKPTRPVDDQRRARYVEIQLELLDQALTDLEQLYPSASPAERELLLGRIRGHLDRTPTGKRERFLVRVDELTKSTPPPRTTAPIQAPATPDQFGPRPAPAARVIPTARGEQALLIGGGTSTGAGAVLLGVAVVYAVRGVQLEQQANLVPPVVTDTSAIDEQAFMNLHSDGESNNRVAIGSAVGAVFGLLVGSTMLIIGHRLRVKRLMSRHVRPASRVMAHSHKPLIH